MALGINWSTLNFTVPQADLTLITGSLYELDTETVFRQGINAIMDDEDGIVFEDPITHNTEVTVAGTTFARTIEMINNYTVEFTPDSQYSVRLAGSNNNIFDVENSILIQNQVQLISQNSAGLINGEIVDQIVEGTINIQQAMRLILSTLGSKVSGVTTSTETFRDTADSKDRVIVTLDPNNNRTAVTLDLT